MNSEIIRNNIKEAREQLQEIEERISNGDVPAEVELQIMLEHAYHHLNVAWNARRVSTKRYSNMTDEEFNKWGKFPKDIAEVALTESATDTQKGN